MVYRVRECRLDNVRGDFSLTNLAYNMRRAINLVGIPAMIAEQPADPHFSSFHGGSQPESQFRAITPVPHATDTADGRPD